MKLTLLSIALICAMAASAVVLEQPAAGAANPDPTKDTKVAEIMMDFKRLYAALATLPRQTVIESRDFDDVLGPYVAGKLRQRDAERIFIDGNRYQISLAHSVTESGPIVATTLQPEISFTAGGTADNFTMSEIKGISAKPKSLPIPGASVRSLHFSKDCADNTVIEIHLSAVLFLRSREIMVLAPDGTRVAAAPECRSRRNRKPVR